MVLLAPHPISEQELQPSREFHRRVRSRKPMLILGREPQERGIIRSVDRHRFWKWVLMVTPTLEVIICRILESLSPIKAISTNIIWARTQPEIDHRVQIIARWARHLRITSSKLNHNRIFSLDLQDLHRIRTFRFRIKVRGVKVLRERRIYLALASKPLGLHVLEDQERGILSKRLL